MYYLYFSIEAKKYEEFCRFFDISDFPTMLDFCKSKFPGCRWKLSETSPGGYRKKPKCELQPYDELQQGYA